MQEVAHSLDELSNWLLQEQYRRRHGSRGRPIHKMGKDLRAQLFTNLLTGAWALLPHKERRLGSVITDDMEDDPEDRTAKYRGPFLAYVQSFCTTLAAYIEAQRPDIPAMIGLAKDLRLIARHPANVRDGIQKSGFRKLALKVATRELDRKN